MSHVVEIRGINFKSSSEYVSVKDLSSLYIVFKALEGDVIAKEILDKYKKVLHDADGKQIYPPVEK